jgi:asparagine synthase (glutamine-hydrolysing)
MCGIVGIVSKSSMSDSNLINNALSVIKHRGPDDSGIWFNENKTLALGHCRLSIVDLSRLGSQPMILESRFVITFNGEIYNFRDIKIELESYGVIFISNSDTEVILHSYKIWGKKCVDKFNGMFAFAIYDIEKKSLFFARDRSGEKPLYFSLNHDKFFFSSELKGIFELCPGCKDINAKAFSHFLTYGFVPKSDSIIANVFKLKPGHTLLFSLSDFTYSIEQYWSIPLFNYNSESSNDELVIELEKLLNDSVKIQSMADVDVGVLLSGGLDSSIITSIASRNLNKVSTFSVSFPGHGKFDESAYSNQISNYFGTKHTLLNANDLQPEDFLEIANKIDEPIIDTSFLPTYILSNLISKHCKVALGGDGADELFGGYMHYPNLIKQFNFNRYIPLSFRNSASKIFVKHIPIGFKGRNWLTTIGNDYSKSFPIVAQYYNNYDKKKLLNNFKIDKLPVDNLFCKNINNDLIYSATRSDFENYLSEDILVKVDRASMLNSLEIRAPYLDYRIIEFAFKNVPSKFKINDSNRKVILHLLGKKILPQDFNINRKQGFSLPISNLLNETKWKKFIREILLDKEQILFNHNYIEKQLSNIINDKSGESLLGLVFFQLWLKKNNIQIS